MGCSNSTEPNQTNDSHSLTATLALYIDSNNVNRIKKLFRSHPNNDFHSCKMCVNSLQVTPLAYALAKNQIESFQTLINLKMSVEHMEQVLNTQGFRSIDLVCMQSSIAMLDFYLPFYYETFIMRAKKLPKSIQDTISLTAQKTNKKIYKTPMQYACFYKNFNSVRVIKRFFADKETHFLFDLEYQDEELGENCALMSCRLGCYKLMKFLYEECQADFTVVNKKGESALLIVANESKKVYSGEILLCFRYLIEVIQLDLREELEEILNGMESYKMVQAVFEALESLGVVLSKSQLELMSRLGQFDIENEEDDLENFVIIDSSKVSVLSTVKIENGSIHSSVHRLSGFFN